MRKGASGVRAAGGGPWVGRAALVALALAACARSPQPEAPAPAAQRAATDTARAESPQPAPRTPQQAPDTNPHREPPTLGAPPDLALPPIVRRELANGLKLMIVEHHELPVADFILLVGTGGEGDPAGKTGLASLTADMLREGTTTRSALQIADQEAFLGVELGTGSGWDASRVTLHAPTAQLDSALALFADVALRPAFPQRELDRVRQERLTELMQIADHPPQIADLAHASLLFGAEHPYGRPLAGTQASVKGVARADLRRFYDGHFRPNNATLIVVGDVTPDDITARVERLFGSWQRGAVPASRVRAAPAPAATTVYLIDKPGAPQSSVRIGAVGVARSTEDFFALQVLNTILGGSFTSRLNQNLRETKGYTYGARSRFEMRREPGPFIASAEVTGTKTDSSLIEFMKELTAIRDTVPAPELEKAKRYIQLGMPARFETTGDIAVQLIPVALYGLPLDYYDSYVRRVEAVTQADVQRVARRYVDPSKMVVVIVGDRQSIEPGLRALSFGKVELRDIEGRAVRR
jgi:predicted Zn-dependent peptidase